MEVEMKEDRLITIDGVSLKQLEKGKVYDLPMNTACFVLCNGYAKHVEDTAGKISNFFINKG